MTRGFDLQAVGRQGKRIRTGCLEVRVVASPVPFARVGIVVAKHRHSSVERNRLKRRLRELVRARLLPALASSSPLDIVVRTRAEAYEATFAELGAQVERVQRAVTERTSDA